VTPDQEELLVPRWLDAANGSPRVEDALASGPLTSAPPFDSADELSDLAVRVSDVHVTFEALADRYNAGRRALSLKSREIRHIPALQGVSLDLHTGDALGLIGHNGAGKSTLMHALAGFIQPSRGEVLVRSQPLMLGVNATLNQHLSGHRNISLGLLALGVPRAELPELATDVAESTKLGSFLDLPVKSYSTGMRLRLSFAISTIRAPDILLIDEALAVGDKQFKEQSLRRLNEIRDDAGVVIVASHSLNEIKRTCNRVLWLEGGRVVRLGPTAEVLPDYRKARLASPGE